MGLRDICLLLLGKLLVVLALILMRTAFSHAPSARWGQPGQGVPMSRLSQIAMALALLFFALLAVNEVFRWIPVKEWAVPVFVALCLAIGGMAWRDSRRTA